MSRFITVNLADVPPPAIIESLDFETIRDEIVADATYRINAAGISYNADTLESDPFVKLAEAYAFRELNLRARVNDAVKAIMLASAWGTNLDNVGKPFVTQRAMISSAPGVQAQATVTFTANPNFGDTVVIGGTPVTFSVNPNGPTQVRIGTSLAITLLNLLTVLQRSQNVNLLKCSYDLAGFVLTITAKAADATGNAITIAVNTTGATVSSSALVGGADPVDGSPEDDDSYRDRIQLAPEAFSSAGPEGGYVYFALQVLGPDGAVDASAVMTKPGYVRVTVMMGSGVFQPTQAQILKLATFFVGEEAKPLTDIVSIAGPVVVPSVVEAVLTLYPGPDKAVVLRNANNALSAMLASEQKLGHDLVRSQIIAALQQNGVQSVNLISPSADVSIDDTQVFNVTQTKVTAAPYRST